MTTKNRSKNNSQSGDRSVSGQQRDDVAKKSPKVDKAENATVPSPESAPGALMKLASALLCVCLAAAAAFASMYVQRELSDIRNTSSRLEEAVRRSSAAGREVEEALQQMRSMKASLEALESTVVSARADLDSTSRAVQKGEASGRQMEAALQKLQNKISQELTEGMQEVKEAREKDISSLERTLEERLVQLSRSITESVEEFAGEQSQYKNELGELKARMQEKEADEPLKQELASISSAVAHLHTASEVAEGNVAVLREQIAAVGAELQTRNKEVASVSEEIEAVRSLVQSAVATLREELSAARAGLQSAADQVQTLSNRQDQFSSALQSLETQLMEQLLKAQKRGEDVEARVKAGEENQEVVASSLAEQNNRLNALDSRVEAQELSLTSYRTAAQKESQALRGDLEEARSLADALQKIKWRLDAVEQSMSSRLGG